MPVGTNSQDSSQKPASTGQSPTSGRPGAAAPVWACRSAAAIIIFLLLATIATAADLLSKHFVFDSFLSDPSLAERLEEYRIAYKAQNHDDPSPKTLLSTLQRPVCPGVRFTLSANPGIVFGLPMARTAVNIATMLAVVLVLGFFATSDSRAWLLHVALAMILAGAVGNLYDRMFSSIKLPGCQPIENHVRDFIDCSEVYYKWVFNVADMLLVIGVGLLFIHSIFSAGKHRRKAVN